jgi:hypothetical protein
MTTILHYKKGLEMQQTHSSFADEGAKFNNDEVPASINHFFLGISVCQKVLEV